MKILSGISAAPGIVTGRAFLYQDDLEIPRYTIPPEQTEKEIERFVKAVEETTAEMRAMENNTRNMEQSAIIDAHLQMVEDPDFHYKVKVRLESRLENIEWAVSETARELSRKLMDSPSDYLRERAADIADVSRHIIKRLLGFGHFSLADLREDVILVTGNLLPSDVLGMNKDRVKALVMETGSRTNHTVILLRSFAIPAILGLSSAILNISNGSLLIVDGGAGQVILDPDAETVKRYSEQQEGREPSFRILPARNDLPAETADGKRIYLYANIGIPEDAEEISRYGAEGVGLFRSEFLFLDKNSRNSEDDQREAYSRVIKAMKGKITTIRTVDLGGHNEISGAQYKNEKNPLMGWRAIRYSLSLPDLFKTQLRAILRAGVHGKVRIMFPMVSGIEELEQALGLLDEVKSECRKKDFDFGEDIETGIMIEIPSAAMTADILAEKSDFFSIGTNDLILHSLAVDRENEKVRHLAQSAHPAILRFIRQTISAAHAKGIKAAMCGEMAGDPAATALLIGMDLDEFSMTAVSIPQVKHIIRNVSFESCKTLAETALACASYKQVQSLIQSWYREHFPGLVLSSDMILETPH